MRRRRDRSHSRATSVQTARHLSKSGCRSKQPSPTACRQAHPVGMTRRNALQIQCQCKLRFRIWICARRDSRPSCSYAPALENYCACHCPSRSIPKKGSPVFHGITEGRRVQKPYSAVANLAGVLQPMAPLNATCGTSWPNPGGSALSAVPAVACAENQPQARVDEAWATKSKRTFSIRQRGVPSAGTNSSLLTLGLRSTGGGGLQLW